MNATLLDRFLDQIGDDTVNFERRLMSYDKAGKGQMGLAYFMGAVRSSGIAMQDTQIELLLRDFIKDDIVDSSRFLQTVKEGLAARQRKSKELALRKPVSGTPAVKTPQSGSPELESPDGVQNEIVEPITPEALGQWSDVLVGIRQNSVGKSEEMMWSSFQDYSKDSLSFEAFLRGVRLCLGLDTFRFVDNDVKEFFRVVMGSVHNSMPRKKFDAVVGCAITTNVAEVVKKLCLNLTQGGKTLEEALQPHVDPELNVFMCGSVRALIVGSVPESTTADRDAFISAVLKIPGGHHDDESIPVPVLNKFLKNVMIMLKLKDDAEAQKFEPKKPHCSCSDHEATVPPSRFEEVEKYQPPEFTSELLTISQEILATVSNSSIRLRNALSLAGQQSELGDAHWITPATLKFVITHCLACPLTRTQLATVENIALDKHNGLIKIENFLTALKLDVRKDSTLAPLPSVEFKRTESEGFSFTSDPETDRPAAVKSTRYGSAMDSSSVSQLFASEEPQQRTQQPVRRSGPISNIPL